MTQPSEYSEVISAFLRQIAAADQRVSELRTDGGVRSDTPAGRLVHAMGELDIAMEELHTAEEELRTQNEELLEARLKVESERRRYFELFHYAPLAYLVTDSAGVIQEANRAAYDLFRRPARFLTGKPIGIFVPEAERAVLRNLIHRVSNGQPGRQRLALSFHPTGASPFHAEVIAEAMIRHHEPVPAIRWILIDQGSERGTVPWERAALTTLAGSLDEAVVVVDQHSCVCWWNRAAELAFGYSAEEVVGKRSPVELPDVNGECTVTRKNGRNTTLQVRTLPLHAIDGAPLGRLFRMRRQRNDRRVRHDNGRDKIAARLAGGVAHHLNNLMQVMLSGAEIAGEDVRNSAQLAADLKLIKEAAARAVAVTRALVTYTGQDLAWPRPVDLNTIVAEAIETVSPRFAGRIECDAHLESGLPSVFADAEAVGRIARELLINGFLSIEGRGKLLVETASIDADRGDLRRNERAPEGYVEFAVHDNGRGMDEVTKQQLFEPFFAARDAGKPVGMGLAAAWSSVTRAGGFIRVESSLGIGTSFRVYLPKAASPISRP